MPLSGLDLAIYGFNRNIQKVEEAGISYELRIIRDKLTLGLSTEPILKQSSTVECVIGKWTSLDNVEENGIPVTVFTLKTQFNFKNFISLSVQCF